MSSWGLFGRRVTNARKTAATASLTAALTKLLASVRTLKNTNINSILAKTPNNSRQFLRSVVAYIMAVNKVNIANKAVETALVHVSNGRPESIALAPVKNATNANLAAARAAEKVNTMKNTVSVNGKNVTIVRNTNGKWVFGNTVNNFTRATWNVKTNNSGGAYVVPKPPPVVPQRPRNPNGPNNALLRRYLSEVTNNGSPKTQMETLQKLLSQNIKNITLVRQATNRLNYLKTLTAASPRYVPPQVII